MTARREGADYTAVSDRMAYLLVLRFALAVVVILWSLLRPEALGTPVAALVAWSGAYLAAAVVGEWARRRVGRVGHAVLSVLLLLDGLYLAYGMYVTGGTQSPMRFLIYLHLVAVSLLASYRTGLKIALWHSLLLFVVLYAQAASLLPPVDALPGANVAFDRMALLNVSAFWLFALATSVFSAMNERELRQRRADLQALVDLGARLDDVTDPHHQARIVLESLATRFGFSRGLLLGASDEQLISLAASGSVTAPPAHAADAVVRLAWTRREILALRRLRSSENAALSAALPDARNLLVAPMIVDGRPVGALIVEHRSRSIFGVERRLVSVLGQFAAVAALNLRNAVLLRHVQDLAERDALTGAANRRMFQESLERTLTGERSGRTDSQPVTAVLFIDVDDFKVVNDTLGHAAGDHLLVAMTERIGSLVRQGDLVARLGGDEFAILTEDDAELSRSRAMAARLVRDLRAPYQLGGHHVTVSTSIGIASARGGTDTADQVVRDADVAMYMAKANGKAGYAIFDPAMHAAIRERHELGAALQRAVELDQLHLVYQPIVDLRSGSIAGLEVLLRWSHPERGPVSPGEFIEIAEENGAILSIGRWVLREACQRAVRWERDGQVRPGMFVSVNVSAREIQQPGFVDAVHETLLWAEMAPANLILEITETALLRATPATVTTLEALRALGVRVVIDDFGTGYFSLSHLRQFPVDALKIATEFVQVAETDVRSSALAGAIVAMSDSLGIDTVAEGIETEEQAVHVRTLGCTYGQGYFFARPLAEADITAGVEGIATEHRWQASAGVREVRRPGRARRAPRSALRPA